MNPEAQAKLDEILKKDVRSLTPGDIVFLRARRSYLNKDERKKYGKVLTEKPKAKVVEEAESEAPSIEEKKPRKKK